MPYRNQVPELIAGGNINPATFVIISNAANNTGLQSGANGIAIGICNDETYQPPGVIGAATYCVPSGYPIPLFGVGEICNLVAGTAGFTAADPIKSDGNGNGVTATSAGTDIVCAFALETITSGLKGRVLICTPHKL